MIKLYRRTATGELRYHEAWATGRKLVEHWGIVGERGETREHKLPSGSNEDAAIDDLLAHARSDGFEEIEEVKTLIIEYQLDSWGKAADVERRGEVEGRMTELLGWTGLGHCDGGSIGSGTMEVCCFVVDFEIAVRIIAADLRDSPYADYSRIYDEEAEP